MTTGAEAVIQGLTARDRLFIAERRSVHLGPALNSRFDQPRMSSKFEGKQLPVAADPASLVRDFTG